MQNADNPRVLIPQWGLFCKPGALQIPQIPKVTSVVPHCTDTTVKAVELEIPKISQVLIPQWDTWLCRSHTFPYYSYHTVEMQILLIPRF